MTYVQLGKSLRECRESVLPEYSRDDLAACIFRDPICQGIFSNPTHGSADLIPVIKELEDHGTWTLSPDILAPFLQASINCLPADCSQNLLTKYTAIVVHTIIANLDPDYTTLVDHYLPQPSNPSENENGDAHEEQKEDDDSGND